MSKDQSITEPICFHVIPIGYSIDGRQCCCFVIPTLQFSGLSPLKAMCLDLRNYTGKCISGLKCFYAWQHSSGVSWASSDQWVRHVPHKCWPNLTVGRSQGCDGEQTPHRESKHIEQCKRHSLSKCRVHVQSFSGNTNSRAPPPRHKQTHFEFVWVTSQLILMSVVNWGFTHSLTLFKQQTPTFSQQNIISTGLHKLSWKTNGEIETEIVKEPVLLRLFLCFILSMCHGCLSETGNADESLP